MVIYVKTKISEKEFPLAFITPKEKFIVNHTGKDIETSKVQYKNVILYFPCKIKEKKEINEEIYLVLDKNKTAVIAKKTSDLETIHPDLINDTRIKTEYDLYNESLTMTPDRMSIFDSYDEAKRKSRLLAYKVMYTIDSKNILKFKAKNTKGFQFGDPKFDNSIKLYLFDNMVKKYCIESSGFGQEEIDFVLNSIMFE